MKALLALLFALLPLAWAQFASGPNPAEVARDAVEVWQTRARAFDPFALAMTSPEAACREFAAIGQDPGLVAATRVNFDDLRELSRSEERIVYSYPSVTGVDALGRVEVSLVRQGELWQAEAVRLQLGGLQVGLPGFLRHDATGWLFILLSGYLVYLLARPSWLRRWLAEGWGVLKRFRGIVIVTIIALYGAYGLGSWFGVTLPDCQLAVATLAVGGLDSIGVVDVLQANNVPKLAAVITYWNFTQGTLLTTLIPAYLFAIPAYVINLGRFFVLGVALAPVGPLAALLPFHVPVILIELLAYTLVTAGGAIFLVSFIREGLKGYRTAVRRLLLTLPIAFILLVAGAWYESFAILRLIPAVAGP
ncbi:MAG: hypothetical protein KGZ60_12990 [Truepera sp.]|nr:hypothetical protein [Truepera sp.]